jgi:hypothetical protein
MHCGRGGVCNFVPVGNTNRYKIPVLCQVGWPVLNDVAFSTGQTLASGTKLAKCPVLMPLWVVVLCYPVNKW